MVLFSIRTFSHGTCFFLNRSGGYSCLGLPGSGASDGKRRPYLDCLIISDGHYTQVLKPERLPFSVLIDCLE